MTLGYPGFGGAQFDRGDRLRLNGEADGALRNRIDARLLLLDGLDPRFADDGGLAWGSLADGPEDRDLVFLGLDHGSRPCYAACLGGDRTPYPANRNLWNMIGALLPDEAGFFATARSLVDWHNRHGFCAVCGSPSVVVKAGWSRQCPQCRAEHFPRVDPVVIMLAEHQDKVLVGRQPQFPPRNFSALAGFVEPGETIEGAVIRELHEEAGIRAHSVRYMASQPWPFPSSLMMGCVALTDDPALDIDTDELETAMWVSAEDVRAALEERADSPFIAPPRLAIANFLFRAWLAEKDQ